MHKTAAIYKKLHTKCNWTVNAMVFCRWRRHRSQTSHVFVDVPKMNNDNASDECIIVPCSCSCWWHTCHIWARPPDVLLLPTGSSQSDSHITYTLYNYNSIYQVKWLLQIDIIHWFCSVDFHPFPSNKQHLSYDDGKLGGAIIRTVLRCIIYDSCAQWHANIHVNSSWICMLVSV